MCLYVCIRGASKKVSGKLLLFMKKILKLFDANINLIQFVIISFDYIADIEYSFMSIKNYFCIRFIELINFEVHANIKF